MSIDKGPRGEIVWRCENGHVDWLHRTSARNLCMTCRDGVCEPVKTLGRRSPEQRERDKELGVHTPRRRSSKPKKPAPSTIRIIRPGHDPITVEAEALSPKPTPPFKLKRADRTAILAYRDGGKLPEITFPKIPPPDFPDNATWPADPGDVLEVTKSVRLVVTGRHFRTDDLLLHYLIEDRRPEPGSRITTTKAREKVQNRLGGPEFAAEREGAMVSCPKITRDVHLAELRKLEKTRDDLGRQLAEMTTAPRDIRRPLRMTIDGLERRIGYLRGELGLDRQRDDHEAAA